LALHGWQDNAGTFDKLAPLLVAQGHSVLAIDFPGNLKITIFISILSNKNMLYFSIFFTRFYIKNSASSLYEFLIRFNSNVLEFALFI